MAAVHQLVREDLESLLGEADPDLWETVMPTVAEEWMKEGEARGLMRGKGETLLRLLERRFGAVPEDAGVRILAAPVGDLDAWLDAFVSASSLDDAFGNGAVTCTGASCRLPSPSRQPTPATPSSSPESAIAVIPARFRAGVNGRSNERFSNA